MSRDLVVIGAGVSGLTAALILARHGRRVTLVEKAGRTAPLLSGFSRGGARFDTGFHYAGGLDGGEILDRLLGFLGMAGDLKTTPYDKGGFDRISTGAGYEFRFPSGFDRIRERLSADFPREEAAVRGFLEAVERGFDSFPYLNRELRFPPPGDSRGTDSPSLREVLDGLTDDPLLRRILSCHCLLHGVGPDAIPFDLHAAVVGSYYRGVRGIEGGGRALARAFTRALERSGVAVVTGRGARLVRCRDREVSGVELEDGEVIGCTGVVATCHPALLPSLVPPGSFTPAFGRRLTGLSESVAAHALFAACDFPPGEAMNFNRYLLPLPGDAPILGTEAPPGERLLYITFHRRGPGESSDSLTALCPADPGETAPWAGSRSGRRPAGYGRFKEEVTAALLPRIAGACPELGSIKPLALATPLTFRDRGHNPHGSLYGAAHRVGQLNPFPPTRLRGLYLSGQATAAPGVVGSMLSAFLTCGHIVGHELLRREVWQ